jgi:hypothetical protein
VVANPYELQPLQKNASYGRQLHKAIAAEPATCTCQELHQIARWWRQQVLVLT